jgi:arsenate reductase
MVQEPIMSIVIHHNPDAGRRGTCSRSSAPLPVNRLSSNISRLDGPAASLLGLFAAAGLSPREALRVSKSPAEELGLTDPSVSDEVILDAMIEHPVLVNRPIVCTRKGRRLVPALGSGLRAS